MHSMAVFLPCLIDRSPMRRFLTSEPRAPLPEVNFAKIVSARLNALSTAAAGVIRS